MSLQPMGTKHHAPVSTRLRTRFIKIDINLWVSKGSISLATPFSLTKMKHENSRGHTSVANCNPALNHPHRFLRYHLNGGKRLRLVFQIRLLVTSGDHSLLPDHPSTNSASSVTRIHKVMDTPRLLGP